MRLVGPLVDVWISCCYEVIMQFNVHLVENSMNLVFRLEFSSIVFSYISVL